MNIVIVELPAKAKTVNKYLGPGYQVLASYGHVRDLPSKNGSVEPDKDFEMHWDVEPKAAKRLDEIAKALKGASKLILATDPDREGEAISWHVLQVLDRKKAPGRAFRSSAWFSTPSPKRPCSRPCAIRARSTARWSTPISPAARSTISSASPSPRCCGGSCPAPAPPAACSRWRSASSATASSRSRNSRRRNIGRSWPSLRPPRTRPSPARLVVGRRQEARQVRHCRRRRPPARLKAALEGGRFTVVELESKPQRRNPAAALHHLDPAAGSLAQARLLAAPDHAARAAAL